MGEVIAVSGEEPHACPVTAGQDPKTIVLDLARSGRRALGGRRQARFNEAERAAGTRTTQHVVLIGTEVRRVESTDGSSSYLRSRPYSRAGGSYPQPRLASRPYFLSDISMSSQRRECGSRKMEAKWSSSCLRSKPAAKPNEWQAPGGSAPLGLRAHRCWLPRTRWVVRCERHGVRSQPHGQQAPAGNSSLPHCPAAYGWQRRPCLGAFTSHQFSVARVRVRPLESLRGRHLRRCRPHFLGHRKPTIRCVRDRRRGSRTWRIARRYRSLAFSISAVSIPCLNDSRAVAAGACRTA